VQNKTEERGMRREDGRRRMEEGGWRRRKTEVGGWRTHVRT
jgi:hypothetical protein